MRNWIDSKADYQDIIINSSVKLSRNIKDLVFTDKLIVGKARENISRVMEALGEDLDNNKLQLVKLWELEDNYIKSYLEKGIITKKLFDRKEKSAFLYNSDNTLTVMINEEEHISIKCISDGLNLKEEYKYVNRIDDIIEEKIPYAFHEEFGYLTQSPKNVGTALKGCISIHLPALKASDKISKISNDLDKVGISINSMYCDKNNDYGNIYVISNKVSLGLSEEDILNNLEREAFNIIYEEKKCRELLMAKYKYEVEDRVYRANAILRNARIISSKEIIELLSDLRLGVEMSLLEIDKNKLNKILVNTRDIIIQNNIGANASTKDINAERARITRDILNYN